MGNFRVPRPPRRQQPDCEQYEQEPQHGLQLELSHNSSAKFSLPRRRPARANSPPSPLVIRAQVAALCALALIAAATAATLAAARQSSASPAALAAEQLIRQAFSQQPLSPEGLSFDGAQHKSIYEAIRAHPDLREFASLCETKGVREIVSMDKIALTVFAPIDRSLGDLLAKSRERSSINLIELAKHHIAQGLVMPDESMKFPFQFQSYALLSPLYLSQAAGAQPGTFVNNAKILASYLIPIDAENFQTLHVIDEPLAFAYANRVAQVRQQPASSGLASNAAGGSGGAGAQAANSARKQVVTRRPLALDDLVAPAGELADQAVAGLLDFADRFGDLTTGEAYAELYRARAHWARLAPGERRARLDYDALARKLPGLAGARAHWARLNESRSLNTYFLPVNGKELEQLVAASGAGARARASEGAEPGLQELDLTLQAHVIPDQVLFTRAMSLGQLHATLFNGGGDDESPNKQARQTVSLALAKQVPLGLALGELAAAGRDHLAGADADAELARRLAASPLMLQAKCAPLAAQTGDHNNGHSSLNFRAGLTQAEIVLANIPLANGVLHLIRRPVLREPASDLLNFINDNDHQLSTFVQSLGSQSGPLALAGPPVELNRFRELLVRDHDLLATFSNDLLHSNRTLLAPTDDAFARLRFDLRALVQGDEQLVPAHWDPSYRRDLLERLMKRHIIPDATLTSADLQALGGPVGALNGQPLTFSVNKQLAPGGAGAGANFAATNLQVQCDATSARLLHRDLIGTNGVLHVIDRVLGEELETVHSLMRSLVLRSAARLAQEAATASSSASGPLDELSALIERQLALAAAQPQLQELELGLASSSPSPPASADGELHEPGGRAAAAASKLAPELGVTAKTVARYLDELSRGRRELLAASVNISYQLGRLVSRAELRADWNEQFAATSNGRQLTYFVPNDLAWLRLLSQQPELYKPLVYFLGSAEQAQAPSAPAGPPAADAPAPRSSESSHRLLQILERHLVVSRALTARELGQLTSIQTLGASLRLVDAAPTSQLLQASVDGTAATPGGGQTSAFAALHSIISGAQAPGGGAGAELASQPAAVPHGPAGGAPARALKLGATQANIVQAHETSNGNLYLIDNVLTQPEDIDYIVQTGSAPAVASSMSSLLGGRDSALLELVRSLFSSNTIASATTMATLIGSLLVAILVLALVALVLAARKRSQNKSLNRHQQLESGLASSSSANSGSTSTTKSL